MYSAISEAFSLLRTHGMLALVFAVLVLVVRTQQQAEPGACCIFQREKFLI
jgi:hypothetical protein